MKNTKIFLLFGLLVLLFSCKTLPPVQGIEEPFGVIGNEADVYVYIPVKENRTIIEQSMPMVGANDMKTALGRTNEIFSGIFFNGLTSEVRICMKGQYPYKMTGSFFKKKNGWNPKKTKKGYKYYESSFVDVSIPSPLIACLGLGSENRQKMDVILDKLEVPVFPQFSEKFDALLDSNSDEIGIFVKNSDFFLSQIIGVRLGLPLGNIEMYLRKGEPVKVKGEEQLYEYDLSIQVENPRTAMVLKLFLRKMLKVEPKHEGDFVIIEGRIIPESKIVQIVKSVYPY